MTRKLFSVLLVVLLTMTTMACGSPETSSSTTSQSPQPTESLEPTQISDGEYPVQQATYDDVDGTYTLMLLNTAPGESSVFRTTNLPMARLTDEEINANKEDYLKVEQGQPALHLSKDSKIEYVHNVTETQTNAQTGQEEVVVVRQESSFWTPFAGALAGQALGSLLFTPHYYFPPVYQPGVVLTGYSSYGRTYDQAVQQYRSRYNAPPTEVRNRQFRTTGRLRSTSSAQSSPRSTPRTQSNRSPSSTSSPRRTQTNRPSGSGYGSTDLSPSSPSRRVRQPSSGFGSSRSRSRPRSRRR